MNPDLITISKEVYEELLRDSMFLTALECAGVDNWSGYEYAVQLFQEIKKEDDNVKSI